ncbi:receptor-transporting protein 3 [Talpa occidentalis]|uniref:receptor-transporting protein 3 n=1 Tax=Talpa occidentalis TaxID=50954 RepID=UPI00188F3FB9|nr:receptor-transporting protein 3 [Talpa occidentalis]
MGQDMEEWKQEFQTLIQEVKPGHRWTLTPDKYLLPDNLKPGWIQYQQHTFARFQCSLCLRSWASAHVQVLFHMHRSEGDSRGEVKMRVFAQRCQKCSQPPFEAPQFMKENISRILNNLVLRILKKCYKEGFKLVEIPTIKEVSLEGPHDSHNCEACLQGFCAESRSGPVSPIVQPPVSPLLPQISSQPGRVTSQKPFPTRSSPSPIVDTVKKEKRLPSPQLSGPTQAVSYPTYWIPEANTGHDVAPPSQELSSPHMAQNPTHMSLYLCRRVPIPAVIIIIIIVAVFLTKKSWLES